MRRQLRVAAWVVCAICAFPISVDAKTPKGEKPAPADDAAKAQPSADAQDSLVPELKVGGRVFARAEASSQQEYSRAFSLPSARLSLEAKWKGLLKAQVEADIAEARILKDAWLELKLPLDFAIRGGRFRAPFSLRQTTSRWELPLVYRGMANDFAGGAGLGGRRLGAQLEFSKKSWKRLEVKLGAFQGTTPDNEDLAGRVTFRPLDFLTLGASGWTSALGAMGTAGGLDATVKAYGFELATEALVVPELPKQVLGSELVPPSSWAQTATALLTRRTFLGKGGDERYWLEPVVAADWLRESNGAQWMSGTLGLNAGKGDIWRLQVQAARGLLELGQPVQTRLTAQLGARF